MQSAPPLKEIPDASAATFSRSYAVRFSHCDPAAMVFYPQYFVLLQGLVEDWFTQGLGVDYTELIVRRRIGLPSVSLQAEFVAPSRMGETITFELRVERLGTKSLTLGIVCSGADGRRARFRQVVVSTSFSDDGAIAIPADIVEAIVRWQGEAAIKV